MKKPIEKKSDTVEIMLPEKLTSYLTPVIMIILFAFIWFKVDREISSLEKSIKELKGSTTTADVAGADNTSVDISQIKALFDDKTHLLFGSSKSDLIFVEVSDPSCPYCSIASGKNPELNKMAGAQFTMVADGGSYVAPVAEMKKLVEEEKASFVYIYNNGHGNGELAAQALYCAYDEKKFWEVHDLLMSGDGYSLINGENVENFTGVTAEQLAKFLAPAVKESTMLSCLTEGKYAERLTRDMQVAGSLGVSGTPGFFINETNFAGAYSWTDMKSTVDAILED